METQDFPFGVVVKDHHIKTRLNNLNEIQSYLLREKTAEEVNRIIVQVVDHPCTIMLYGREWLMTELR